MPEMSSVVPKHMKTMCHTIIYKFVDPEITVPLNFNMAAGGHLGFSKMRVFCLKPFSLTLCTIYI